MVVNSWAKVTSKCILDYFRKDDLFSLIQSYEEELFELESINTNFENWIWIDQDLPTFGELSDKEIADLWTKNHEESIDVEDDDEETNVKIT